MHARVFQGVLRRCAGARAFSREVDGALALREEKVKVEAALKAQREALEQAIATERRALEAKVTQDLTRKADMTVLDAGFAKSAGAPAHPGDPPNWQQRVGHGAPQHRTE